MGLLRTAANSLWALACARAFFRFTRAAADPEACQRKILMRCLRRNAGTVFGREHGFAGIRSVEEYRRAVPVRSYEELEPYIRKIAAGEKNVLTAAPVTSFAPTGGSAAPAKLVPFTACLLNEFRSAVSAWVFDMYRRRPGLLAGSAYWSISPVVSCPETASGGIPVRFEEDTEYLGGFLKPLVDATLAVPAGLRSVASFDAFRYVTLLFLLRAADLSFISVWHPSYMALLLQPLEDCWNDLLDDMRAGTLNPSRAGEVPEGMASRLVPDPARAAVLGRTGPRALDAVWPSLRLISCWADAGASGGIAELQSLFPSVEIQPKGLLATEACISIPFAGRHPAACTSHFLEFMDDAGVFHGLSGLRTGGAYSVVLTTGGGLYRYDIGDRVEVDGFYRRVPSLRFVGRKGFVSDRRGEKITCEFAASVIDGLFRRMKVSPSFAMLAPDAAGGKLRYALFVEMPADVPGLSSALEQALLANPAYRTCVMLGQLAPAVVYRIRGRAAETYITACTAAGQRAGDVKPLPLSARDGWNRVFEGTCLD
ncbi:MAG: GH3 auxin-responsive promoter family protein [Planctomycetes bacterium]|nr:GH3 auxin-responsive promoter family protein [Planctomycetota bacterium]